ncbi:MAG: GNAT family N-acetyltransferase [Bacteroidota bacterium]
MIKRKAEESDLEAILILYVKSIQETCKNDYSYEQIEAWTASVEDRDKWLTRIKEQCFILIELADELAGFASLENNSYIDLMYVDPRFQGQGVATRLLRELLALTNASELTTDASITARPFFEKHGFEVIKENRFKLKGVEIINYQMTLLHKIQNTIY